LEVSSLLATAQRPRSPDNKSGYLLACVIRKKPRATRSKTPYWQGKLIDRLNAKDVFSGSVARL
jgi:hypothetical protein